MSLLRSFFDFLDYLIMSIILKNAIPAQAPVLIDFLQKVNLPTSDLPSELSGFTLAFDGEQIVGSAGMELLGSYGLLRSVAVAETHRNHQLGQRLFSAALDFARSHEVQEVFLIIQKLGRKLTCWRSLAVFRAGNCPHVYSDASYHPGIAWGKGNRLVCRNCNWLRSSPGSHVCRANLWRKYESCSFFGPSFRFWKPGADMDLYDGTDSWCLISRFYRQNCFSTIELTLLDF